MLRPPTSGGRGESDVHDIDDADIPAKRGQIDDGADERPTPGSQPAEGRPDLQLPGADQGGPGDDLPQRLGERIENGSSSSIATGEPDVLPDVEPPDTTM